MARVRIGDLLVQVGLIDEMQLKSALALQRQYGGRIGDVLVDNGFLDEMMLWRALAKQLGMKLVSIPTLELSAEAVAALPSSLAMKHDVFPVHHKNRDLYVATSDPNDIAAIDDIQARLGHRVKTVLAPAREILWAIGYYYQGMRDPCPPPKTKKSGESDVELAAASPAAAPSTPSPQAPQPAAPPRPSLATRSSFPNPANASPNPAAASPNPAAASQNLIDAAGWPRQSNRGFAQNLTPPPTTPAPSLGAPPQSGYPTTPPAANDAQAWARLDAHLRETNAALRFLVDTCVQRGVFTREEYFAKMRDG